MVSFGLIMGMEGGKILGNERVEGVGAKKLFFSRLSLVISIYIRVCSNRFLCKKGRSMNNQPYGSNNPYSQNYAPGQFGPPPAPPSPPVSPPLRPYNTAILALLFLCSCVSLLSFPFFVVFTPFSSLLSHHLLSHVLLIHL